MPTSCAPSTLDSTAAAWTEYSSSPLSHEPESKVTKIDNTVSNISTTINHHSITGKKSSLDNSSVQVQQKPSPRKHASTLNINHEGTHFTCIKGCTSSTHEALHLFHVHRGVYSTSQRVAKTSSAEHKSSFIVVRLGSCKAKRAICNVSGRKSTRSCRHHSLVYPRWITS